MSGSNLYELFKTVDVTVVSPHCTPELASTLLSGMRAADPGRDPFSVAVRVFWEILTQSSDMQNLPLFTDRSSLPSVFSMVLRCALDCSLNEFDAIAHMTDEQVMLCFNIARWMLGMPQSTFGVPMPRRVGPPAAAHVMNLTQIGSPAVA